MESCNPTADPYEDCTSCSGVTCTTCKNGFIHNNDCVSKCPDGFYGSYSYTSFGKITAATC